MIDPTHKEEMVMGGKMTFTMNSNGDICAVQKAGGVGVMSSLIMQCLQIASAKAADITSKIKHAVSLTRSSLLCLLVCLDVIEFCTYGRFLSVRA